MEVEEQGGVVTTVKEETTKDQDVVARLAEENSNSETPAEEKPATLKAKEEPKPKAEVKPAQPNLDEDEEYVPLDFNSLDPKQQAAVRRVYQQRRKERQRAELLEEQLREAQQRGKRDEVKEEPAPKVDLSHLGERPKAPDPKTWKGTQEEYDKAYEEYEDKRDEYNYKKRRAEEKAQEQKDAEAQRTQQIVETFNNAQEKFVEAHPDYHDVVDNKEPMTDTMFGFVMDAGPEVLYYFGQHLDEWRSIYKMGNSDKAVNALLRVKFRLEFEKEAAEKEAKAAAEKDKGKGNPPPKEKPEVPPAPVGGRAAAPVQKDRSKMTFKERERERFRQNPGQFNYEP